MPRFPALLALLMTNLVGAASAQQATSQVRAVLFFSPSCPHCHEVISQGLPPIVARFGESLVIVAINTQTLEGQRLFRAAGERYGIPPERLGVPLLAVADRALVGSFDIPDQLPGIVEEGLAAGGLPWPEIDGLQAALVASGIEVVEPPGRVEVAAPAGPTDLETAPELAEVETTLTTPGVDPRGAITDLSGAESRTADLSPWQKFDQDRAGNSIALIVLVGMIASVLAVLVAAIRRFDIPRWPGWIVAVIIVAGLVVAGYLSYVEVTYTEAICGPVGDCNTVQQSAYARLFGVLPIGLLGVYGYTLLGLGWMLNDRGSVRWNMVVATGLWLGALFGTLFSIYLTALEPFVIGATCMWCVTSAVLMTLLLWASTPAAVGAWKATRGD